MSDEQELSKDDPFADNNAKESSVTDPNQVDPADVETVEPGTREGVDKGTITNPHDGAPPTEEDLKNPPYSREQEERGRHANWDPHGGEKAEAEGNEPSPRPE